jgi:hypothetical protein
MQPSVRVEVVEQLCSLLVNMAVEAEADAGLPELAQEGVCLDLLVAGDGVMPHSKS